MSYPITVCLDGYVMLPMECKDDVINLRIATPIKPSTQEVIGIIIKQQEQANNIIREEHYGKKA